MTFIKYCQGRYDPVSIDDLIQSQEARHIDDSVKRLVGILYTNKVLGGEEVLDILRLHEFTYRPSMENSDD